MLYCDSCDEMICIWCGIIAPHGGHTKFRAEVVLERQHKQQIILHERKVKEVEDEIIFQRIDLQSCLMEHQEGDPGFEAKKKRLRAQIEEIEVIELILKDTRRTINGTLEVGIPSEIMFNMTSFIKRMDFL